MTSPTTGRQQPVALFFPPNSQSSGGHTHAQVAPTCTQRPAESQIPHQRIRFARRLARQRSSPNLRRPADTNPPPTDKRAPPKRPAKWAPSMVQFYTSPADVLRLAASRAPWRPSRRLARAVGRAGALQIIQDDSSPLQLPFSAARPSLCLRQSPSGPPGAPLQPQTPQSGQGDRRTVFGAPVDICLSILCAGGRAAAPPKVAEARLRFAVCVRPRGRRRPGPARIMMKGEMAASRRQRAPTGDQGPTGARRGTLLGALIEK